MRSLILILPLAAAIAFSGGPAAPGQEETKTPEHVKVSLDQDSYVLGDTAEVTVVNLREKVLLFSLLCDVSVELLDDEEWQTILAPDCSRIRVMPTRVGAKEKAVLPFIVFPGDMVLSEGKAMPERATYRLRLRYQFDDAVFGTAFSQSFAVAAPFIPRANGGRN